MDTDRVNEILSLSVQLVSKEHQDEPPEIRAVLVDHAIRMLTGNPVMVPLPNGATDTTQSSEARDGTPYPLLAKQFGISVDQASDIFRVEDGVIGLSISNNDIDKSKKKGTEEIGLLLCSANQAIHGSDSFLPLNAIRREAEELNRYDSPNFSRVFDVDYFIDNRKKGPAREVRLKTHGREAAQELVQRIVGARTANAS
jgi:hypothetical protein